MLIKKYLVTLIFLSLGLVYAIFVDVLLGQPWYTFWKNFNYGMVTLTQKLTLATLIIFMIVPDLHRKFMSKRSSHAHADHSSDFNSNTGSNSDSGHLPDSEPRSDPAFLSETYKQSRQETGSKE